MRSLILIVVGLLALSGCAEQNDDYLNRRESADRQGDNGWKEFIAPLSVKTQSPSDRMMKRGGG